VCVKNKLINDCIPKGQVVSGCLSYDNKKLLRAYKVIGMRVFEKLKETFYAYFMLLNNCFSLLIES
jgi:hypothetical protein